MWPHIEAVSLVKDVFHPGSYTADHSLSGVQSHADLEIAHMWFTQCQDCAHVLRNPKIACAVSEFRECATQS